MTANELYENWISQNIDRFNYQPYIDQIYSSTSACLKIRFVSIPHLEFTLCDSGSATLSVVYQKLWRDCIVEFDVYPEITADGEYYCSHCIQPKTYQKLMPKESAYYPSQQALWDHHIFEQLLDYCNENFKPTNIIACWVMSHQKEDCYSKCLMIDIKAKFYWSNRINSYPKKEALFLPVLVDSSNTHRRST